MRFQLSRDVPLSRKATLTIDGLLVSSAPLKMWVEGAKGSRFVVFWNKDRQSRLVSLCKILFERDGNRFYENVFKLRFEVQGNDDMSTSIVQEQNVSGNALIESLDVVKSASGELVHGDQNIRLRSAFETKVIAFYLPQFFPFEENDRWWGEGFTEWANVVDAEPQIAGHSMPLLPADLGFYDLRVEDARRRQGELAKQYGIDAFCYYYYWFSGRRLMTEVLDSMLFDGEPLTEFCLCWANESWSRRWDGSEGAVDLLMPQAHDPEIDKLLISDLVPFFNDSRYVKIDGCPVLLVYRLDIMNDADYVIDCWRKTAMEAGFPGLFVVAVKSFGLTEDSPYKVDAYVDFPPHTAVSSEIQSELPINSDFRGKIYDYRQVVYNAAIQPLQAGITFPCVMPRWDNTSRKGTKANIFWNSTPGLFKLWMNIALEQSQQLPLGRRMMFINSWNEWGEGAMLEPDRLFGREYLEAIRSVRGGYVIGPADKAKFALVSNLPLNDAGVILKNFTDEVHLVSELISWHRNKLNDAFRAGRPRVFEFAEEVRETSLGTVIFDHILGDTGDNVLSLRYGQPFVAIGWALLDHGPHADGRVAYLVLSSVDNITLQYHVPIDKWHSRQDVAAYHNLPLGADACYYGFNLSASTDIIDPGDYQIAVVQMMDGVLTSATCYVTIRRAK